MDSLEVLYDHYKETFSLSKEAQSRRNKSFVMLCVLEALSFFMLIRPEKAIEFIHESINKELDLTLHLSNTIIQTLIWLLIAYVMIRYVQDVLYVERQYRYIGTLENELSGTHKIKILEREGSNYQKGYPMVLNFIDLFYKMLMPILFAVINTVRIYQEWMALEHVTIALICDTIIFVALFIIDWFFFFEIHPKITNLCKKYIPFVDLIAKKLRKILKEV